MANRNCVGLPEERLPILPGMMVDAHITTGKRTILAYLLKAITKALSSALQKR